MTNISESGLTLAALSLGSNLGDRLFYISSMERALCAVFADGSVRSSPVMETSPVGDSCVDQPEYLNKIVVGYYGGGVYGLLGACLSIETALGRTRPFHKAPRTADVDILLFGDAEISVPPKLVVPHPGLRSRRFCLEGLMAVDPSIAVPVLGRMLTVGELYKNMGTDVAAQNVSFV